MKNLWNKKIANEYIKKYGKKKISKDLALRIYTTHLLGAEKKLVLHGGGNTSLKETQKDIFNKTTDVMHVKGSGWDMSNLTEEGMPTVLLDPLMKTLTFKKMTDNNMVNFLRNNLLNPSSQLLEEVVVSQSPFKTSIETPLSTQTFSAVEIETYPGGNNDITQVIQSMPGISPSIGGFRNDIIIRGGGPNETVYYIDGIEIPNINHFSTQGSSGGPVGLVNVSFIKDVTLSTSAFGAEYDNALSGVLSFEQKDANIDGLSGNFRLGSSEAGITFEGPISIINNKETSFIFSVRRSYLQFLFKAFGFSFLPDYWDYQMKIRKKRLPHE